MLQIELRANDVLHRQADGALKLAALALRALTERKKKDGEARDGDRISHS